MLSDLIDTGKKNRMQQQQQLYSLRPFEIKGTDEKLSRAEVGGT